MQNPAYRPPETYNEEEKFFPDNFASVIDTGSDYVMSFLSDPEAQQRRTMQTPSLFNQFIPEMPMPFQAFPDPSRANDHLQGLYGKINMQKDNWMMGGLNENTKMPFGPQAALSYKVENAEDFDGNIKVKKVKISKEVEVQKISDVSKMKSNTNSKNTYINKINTLQMGGKNEPAKGKAKQDLMIETKRNSSIKNEGEPESTTKSGGGGMKKVRSCDVLKSDELEKLNLKLEKNRESARNSRIRKKVYIDLLEKTVDQLQQELAATRKQLEANSMNLSKINFQSKPINNLYTAKQQLFERLEKMVTTKADESEISFLIDSLRLRFGASGKERVEVVNSMFKQIMDFLVPVHMKYLLSIASQGKDVFNAGENGQSNVPINTAHSENTEYWNELVSQVNLSESQRKHMVKYRKKLLAEKQKFEAIVHNLNQVRRSVIKQASSLQGVVDDFRSYLSPTQTAKLLLVLEKEKNRKEFTAEKLWSAVAMKKETHDDDASDTSDNFFEEMDLHNQANLDDTPTSNPKTLDMSGME